MTAATQSRNSLRFRGRSFLALVLAPEAPLADWISGLDAWLERSPGFFVGRPVVLDVSAVDMDKAGLADLIQELHGRDIRILGIEGTKQSKLSLGMPPLISGGRQAGLAKVLEDVPAQAVGPARPREKLQSLLIDGPVRSGQSVIHPHGDVTITGSVASGAEVIAGGSIHVYGALRGRAIAGSMGNGQARIFCAKLEAELLAIDGLYRMAEEIDSALRCRRAQIWLEGNVMMMAALN